jgi:putative Mg2+ transporter-C (MgtC) family protein
METYIIQIIAAAIGGLLLGFEREYKSKSAGLRTVPLITLGSCTFTIISQTIGNETSPDRIAANILTGVGFIGAGVVFKQNNTISGITTAATIWVAAAAGMAFGIENYQLGFSIVGTSLIILIGLKHLHDLITQKHITKVYHIIFKSRRPNFTLIEKLANEHSLTLVENKFVINEQDSEIEFIVKGSEKNLHSLNDNLIQLQEIKSFNA